MSEEQMSEEKEKMWEEYVGGLRDFRDLFERYIQNEKEMFRALQERNEDLKEIVRYMANATHGLLKAVNQLIEINCRLVEENQTLHKMMLERAA